MRYSLPITDPQSLEQVRMSDEWRGERGINRLRQELAAVDRQTPAGRAQVVQLDTFLGLLHMSVGEFTEADRLFAEAQVIDSDCPGALRANIEALRGVAALRRGETENCVACCNGSSCIFPLRPRRSTPAVADRARRSATSPRTSSRRPEDLGVRWLLNVAYMTLGDVPRRRAQRST